MKNSSPRNPTTKNLEKTAKISEGKEEKASPQSARGQEHPAGTHLGFLTWLTGCAIRGVVQLLGDHTEELSLVFISIVVGGADADQLKGRHSL